MENKNFVWLSLIIVILCGGAVYLYTMRSTVDTVENEPLPFQEEIVTPPATTTETNAPKPEVVTETRGPETILGTSAGGNDIIAYHFGTGAKELLLVGGIHGGYSWNTALLAYELIDHLKNNPSLIPADLTVTVIPVLNPDGLEKTVGTSGRFNATAVPKDEATRISGRFNEHNVDLNRNFDCEWKAEGTWQSRTVSGGSAAFSEPETMAVRDYVSKHRPTAVIAWYSAAGGVYASNCRNAEVLPETTTLMNTFATAAKYPTHKDFDYYEITGDMVNWFAKQGVPAVSVLLTTHDATEFEKNRAGIEAVIKNFAQ